MADVEDDDFSWLEDVDNYRPISPEEPRKPLIQSKARFIADFEPPDYLLDGILQRRFVYSLTAQTGHGKTAVALLIARLIGGSDPQAALGRHTAEKGQVV